MNDNIKNACEEIDAAMFSGDAFTDPRERKALQEYIDRWQRELKSFEEQKSDLYPCAYPHCKVMRTKAEGGNIFTVCDEHWDSTANKTFHPQENVNDTV
jgi:hypothetical protein